ncbi:hypothetical protein [Dactylosporangium sp. NPDC005555]|uniref:hypothetical protein n=1 Tax=Dactylosporangium sp. NPDC005555 TaxID=3154889 RepID=UPI0033B7C195
MTDNPFAILTDEAVPESRVDIDDVLLAGRARVRRRRGVVAGVCTALVVLVTLAGVAAAVRPPHGPPADPSPAPSPAPSVSVHPTGCTPTALNVGGEIGAASTDPSGHYLALTRGPDPGLLVVYRDGAEVRRYTAAQRIRVTAMNASGVIVGVEALDERAFRITPDGTRLLLAKPTGAVSVTPKGVNAAGDIVGEATMPGKRFRAVLWRHTAPDTPLLLATPAGKSSAAEDITDDGRVIGHLNQGEQPYQWNPDGTTATLATPPGLPGGYPQRIAGDWVIGMVNFLVLKSFDPATGRRTGEGPVKPARWQLSTGKVEFLEATDVFAGGGSIAADGTAVINRFTDAAFWNGTTLLPLPRPSSYDRLQISSMTADGRLLIGWAAQSAGGRSDLFRWDCRR